MPKCWMMCGVPGSGKSTWILNQNFNMSTTVLISTDAIIEERAGRIGKTYSDVFKKEIKSATTEMNQRLRAAISDKKDIIWDQTNTTAKIRMGKLAQLSSDYTKVAVYFQTPAQDELVRRLKSRVGKFVPMNIVMAMASQLEMPTSAEGFEEIIIP